MVHLKTPLIALEVVLSILLMFGILLQTPKATGLGGTIGGGGGDGLGGGYRTRRGLERQIYWTTWVLVGAWLVVLLAVLAIETRFPTG